MGLTIPPLLTPAIPSAYSRHPLCLLPSSPRRRGSRGRWPCPTDVIPAKAGIHYVIPNNGGKNRQPPALSLYRASNHSHCNNVLNGFDRSEERRVGKECRSRWSRRSSKKI